MKIGHVELFVTDTAKAKAFYLDVLGFELVAEQPSGLAWIKCGEVELLLRPANTDLPRTALYQHAASGLVLYTDDLDSTAQTLQARGLVFQGNDGPGCLTFTDPDGHWFQLVNPNHA